MPHAKIYNYTKNVSHPNPIKNIPISIPYQTALYTSIYSVHTPLTHVRESNATGQQK